MPADRTTSSPGRREATNAWCDRTRRCWGRMNSTQSRTKVAARTISGAIGSRTRLSPVVVRTPIVGPPVRDLGPQAGQRAGRDGGPHPAHQVEGPVDVV